MRELTNFSLKRVNSRIPLKGHIKKAYESFAHSKSCNLIILNSTFFFKEEEAVKYKVGNRCVLVGGKIFMPNDNSIPKTCV